MSATRFLEASMSRGGSYAIGFWLAHCFGGGFSQTAGYGHAFPTPLPEGKNLLFENWKVEDLVAKYKGDSPVVCVIRDYRNWMASVLKHSYISTNCPIDERIGIWKANARCYIANEPPITYILYNHWFTCEQYRRAITVKLGVPFSDKKLNIVSEHYGSSFDGNRYAGKAQEMAVLERYKEDVNIPLDEEALQLNQTIFGDIYES